MSATISMSTEALTFVVPGDSARTLTRANRIIPHIRTVIFDEGDEAGCLYEIVEGLVMTSRGMGRHGRIIVDFRGPGSLLGLSLKGRHLLTATSLSRVVLRPIEAEGPAALVAISEHIMAELENAYAKFNVIARMPAVERVAGLLSANARAANTLVLDLPMNRQEMADLLGLTVETVSRALLALRQKGAISTSLSNPYRIEVLDLELLNGDMNLRAWPVDV